MTNIFTSCNVKPNIRYYTKDSYTIASLVESGLGVSIMSELMLGRIPYRVACIPLDPPQYRDIATAVRPGPSPQPCPAFWSTPASGCPSTPPSAHWP